MSLEQWTDRSNALTLVGLFQYVQPAGTDVEYNIIATGQTALTYSIISALGFGTSFVLATAPAVHLKNAVVFDYETMGTNPLPVCGLTHTACSSNALVRLR